MKYVFFQALCSAVEQEKIEKVRSILENQTHVNVNGVNGDGFTLLDLAFMTGNQSLLNLVVHHGGKEGAFFPSPEVKLFLVYYFFSWSLFEKQFGR